MTYATLLVNLESGRSNSQLLLMAAQLAARFQARVIGITACMPIQLLYGDGYIDGEVFEQDRQEIDQEIAAGADGHSRVREWALGGVTRSLLGTPLRSVFVSH